MLENTDKGIIYESPSQKWYELKVLNSKPYQKLKYLDSRPNSCHIYYDFINNCKLQVYSVKLNKKFYQNALQIYDWRRATEFPIVKTHFISIAKQTNSEITLNIFNEYCELRLGELESIPLNFALYLLKQGLVGFQRLFSKFGSFQIKENQIVITQKKKCKVWYKQQMQDNILINSKNSQKEFIHNIFKIFFKRVVSTNESDVFFFQLNKMDNFVDALMFIELFSRALHLKIPNKFYFVKKSIERKNNKMKTIQKQSIYEQKTNQQSVDDNEKQMKSTIIGPKKTKINSIQDLKKILKSALYSTMNSSNDNSSNNNVKFEVKTKMTISIYDNEEINDQVTPKNNSSRLNLYQNLVVYQQARTKDLNTQRDIQKIQEQSNAYNSKSKPHHKNNWLVGQTPNKIRKIQSAPETPTKTRLKNQLINTANQSDQQYNLKQIIMKKNGWRQVSSIFNNSKQSLRQSLKIGQDINLQNQQQQFLLLMKHKVKLCNSFVLEN